MAVVPGVGLTPGEPLVPSSDAVAENIMWLVGSADHLGTALTVTLPAEYDSPNPAAQRMIREARESGILLP